MGADVFNFRNRKPQEERSQQTIVIRLIGGLGNQLFQVQFGAQVARSIKGNLILDDSFLRNSKKSHENLMATELFHGYQVETLGFVDIELRRTFAKALHMAGLSAPGFLKNIFIFDDRDTGSMTRSRYILDGFWQDKKFLDRHFVKNVSEGMASAYGGRSADRIDEDVVCVHVRRGDYLTNRHWFRRQQVVLPTSYYAKAFDHFGRDSFDFHVYTDDEEWAKGHFAQDPRVMVIASSGLSAGQILYEMTSYRNFIIANSTLSWWAAVLAKAKEKRVVIPRLWGISQNSDKMALDGWVVV
jgi:hypothetical protein